MAKPREIVAYCEKQRGIMACYELVNTYRIGYTCPFCGEFEIVSLVAKPKKMACGSCGRTCVVSEIV